MSLGDIFGALVKPVGDYFNRRQEIKAQEFTQELQMKQAMAERQCELIKQGMAADASWEMEQIKNSGWKDEWVLLLLSIPLVGVFIPSCAPTILQGFKTLEQTPDWYHWLIMVIFTAVYGIRIWRRQQTDT